MMLSSVEMIVFYAIRMTPKVQFAHTFHSVYSGGKKMNCLVEEAPIVGFTQCSRGTMIIFLSIGYKLWPF